MMASCSATHKHHKNVNNRHFSIIQMIILNDHLISINVISWCRVFMGSCLHGVSTFCGLQWLHTPAFWLFSPDSLYVFRDHFTNTLYLINSLEQFNYLMRYRLAEYSMIVAESTNTWANWMRSVNTRDGGVKMV